MTEKEITEDLKRLTAHFQRNSNNKNTKLVFFNVQAALGSWLKEIDASSLEEVKKETKLSGPIYY